LIGMKAIKHKKLMTISLPLFLMVGIFFISQAARAEFFTDMATGFLSIFIWALGVILGLVLEGLIIIASYQHFIDSQAVILGWVIVRDICNMFFVVVLMIIAFGTILHLENYNYKKWLPKLILMAVLINFSKTICGLLIDITQVAMLTFVNAFKDIGGGNATEMLGIAKIVTLSQTDNNTGFFTVVGAYILGMIYLIVAIIVIGTMLMMLVMRLVMIWIYVVLSPAAYLLAAFPGGQKYASQWWSEFIKNIVVGPVLAFFIWLSLAALGAGSSFVNTIDAGDVSQANSNASTYNNQILNSSESGKLTSKSSFAGTQASTPSALIQFVVAIGMLVGGLMISQQIGGAAGSMAGKGMSALQKGQAFAGGLATGAAKWTAKRPLSVASWANDRFLQGKGIMDLNLSRVKKGWDTRSEEKKQQRYTQGKIKAGQRMEEGGTMKGALSLSALGEDTFDHLTTWRGIKQTVKGGKRMKRDNEALEGSTEFEQAKFQAKYANLDNPEERVKKRTELRTNDIRIDSEINATDAQIKNLEGDIRTAHSSEHKAELENNKKELENTRSGLLKEKSRNGDKLAYAQQNSRTVYSKEDKEKSQNRVDDYQKKIESNAP